MFKTCKNCKHYKKIMDMDVFDGKFQEIGHEWFSESCPVKEGYKFGKFIDYIPCINWEIKGNK